jgi:uncharacterized protein (DUF1778 family)
MTEPVRYSDRLMIRCQPAVNELIDRAAQSRGMRPSEYVRQAVLTGLRLDGFDLATAAPVIQE